MQAIFLGFPWIHLRGTPVSVAPTLLSGWIRRADDPDRRAKRHGVFARMRRERFPNIRRRGGANRFALASSIRLVGPIVIEA
jgi:hypothetical protein